MTQITAHEGNKSNVLLTELVIVILFFALTAVTAMQMFVGAHQKSRSNALVNRAMIIAQDWAERLNGQLRPEDFLTQAGFAQPDEADAGYCLPEDAEGNEVRAVVLRERFDAGELVTVKISVLNNRHQFGEVDEAEQVSPPAPFAALSSASYFPDAPPPDSHPQPPESGQAQSDEHIDGSVMDHAA